MVSHLYSSFLAGTYEYRMEILDERIYLDLEEISTYWVPSLLISYMENDLGYLQDIMKKKFIRLREYEIREVEWGYQFYYHSLVYEILRCLKERIPILANFHVMFGEYMGKAIQI